MIGPRSLVMVLLAILLLYGRAGLRSRRVARLFRPSSSATAAQIQTRRSRLGNSCFWILAITAASAAVAWIVIRMVLVGAPGASR